MTIRTRINIMKVLVVGQVISLLYGFFLLLRYFSIISDPQYGDCFFGLIYIFCNTIFLPFDIKIIQRTNTLLEQIDAQRFEYVHEIEYKGFIIKVAHAYEEYEKNNNFLYDIWKDKENLYGCGNEEYKTVE